MSAPSDVIIGSHAPLWGLTDWLFDGGPDMAHLEDALTRADIRREAWAIINDLAAALDAHVAAHPGVEWGEAWQSRIGEDPDTP